MRKKLLFLVLFILMVLPISVSAEGIENYYINATIEDDGDLLVEEYFNLTGEYNGFERIIEYANDNLFDFDPSMSSYGGSRLHNGDSLDILEVRAVPIVSEFDFNNISGDVFEKVSYASRGDYGVYEEDYKTNGKSILIYNPSNYDTGFYIKYRISNIAIKHNDVGELGWNIVGNELSESVGKLRVYVNIPNNTSVKAWAHGPLHGKVEIIDPTKILVSIDSLGYSTAIDVRATFDLGVISNSKKTSNVEALPKILLYEEDKANQANYEREQQEKVYQADAERYLAKFEVYPTRYNYELALGSINKVYDEDVKAGFIERLNVAKAIMDKDEENAARELIEYAYEFLSYYNYNKALDSVTILDNEEVRNELMLEIIKIEDLLKEKEMQKEISNFVFGGVLLLILGFLGYFIYILYRKDPKTNFNHKYFRDIPSDLTPESVSYLFNKKISNNALSASMIELVRKKIINVEKVNGNNYLLSKNSSYTNELLSSEKKLLELIFHGRDSIETNEMEKYAKKNYSSYLIDWDDYHDVSTRIAKSYGYFESDILDGRVSKDKLSDLINPVVLLVCILGLLFVPFIALPALIICLIIIGVRKVFRGVVQGTFDVRKIFFTLGNVIIILISIYKFFDVAIMHHFYKYSAWIFVATIFVGIVSIVMTFNKKKRTLEGAEEYKKWLALKNFLNDFGRFQDKEAISVVLWEKYLVFATLFGCAEKVLKYMKLAMPDDPNGYVATYSNLYTVNRVITGSIVSSYLTARSAYTAAHSSSGGSSGGSFSSGGGGGGGFSSGGGSFGGGGGGGRF